MTRCLALHCALASGAAWAPLAALMDDVDWITPDLPGHGAAPADEAGIDYMEDALARVLAVLPGEAIHVVGHSYGGALALRLLADHPDRVCSLTVIEPVMFAAAPPPVRASHWTEMAPFFAAFDHGDREGAAAIFHGLWGAGPWDAVPVPIRRYIRDRIHLIARTAPGIMDDVHNILPRLPQDRPVTVITRRDPPEVMAAIATGLAERMLQARIARLGQGHMIPLTDPARLAVVLRTFWQEGGARV